MLGEIIVSLLISAAVIALIWFLKCRILTPVPVGKNSSITVTIRVSGKSRELEQTVRALQYLDHNGTLPMEILISDEGMDEGTKQVARALVRKNEKIRFCSEV